MPQMGVSKTGNEWKKQEIVIELDGGNPMYPRKVCITFFGDRADMLADIAEGEHVAIQADVESREYNGRWYTNVNGFRIGSAQGASGNQGIAMSDIASSSFGPGIDNAPSITSSDSFSSGEDADDLPF